MSYLTKMLLLFVLLLGCAKKGTVTTRAIEKVTKPPKIEKVVDLGGLPVLRDDALDQSASDGRFTPGEWVAIFGEHLSDNETRVRIGDTSVRIEAHLGSGVLVRMPRQVIPHRTIPVSVRTPIGEAAATITPQSYLIVSDPSANEVRFFRTCTDNAPDAPFEPECDAVSLTRARFHHLSRSGAFLYAVSSAAEGADSESAGERALMVVNMGAKDHPMEIGNFPYRAADGPTALALDGSMEHLFLLTRTALLVFDVSDEAAPRLAAQLYLSHNRISEGGYQRMALLDKGNKGVLLDALANRLTVVDMTDKSNPRIMEHIDVLSEEPPRVVDLVADRSDDRVLHLIEGPNLRLAKASFHKFLPKLTETFESGGERRPSRLVSYRLEGRTLRRTVETPLPSGAVPLYLHSELNGDVLISAVDFSVTKLVQPNSMVGGVRMVVGVIGDALQIGSVFRIDKNRQITKLAEGVSLFLTMSDVPGEKELIVLVMRIGIKKFPPSVGVKLSIDSLDGEGKRRSEQLLRNLSWSFIIPPYSTPIVTFQ